MAATTSSNSVGHWTLAAATITLQVTLRSDRRPLSPLRTHSDSISFLLVFPYVTTKARRTASDRVERTGKQPWGTTGRRPACHDDVWSRWQPPQYVTSLIANEMWRGGPWQNDSPAAATESDVGNKSGRCQPA